jgi:hypothetical protein
VIIRLESLDAKRPSEPIIVICNHTQIINKNTSLLQTNQTKRVWGDRTPLEGKGG